MKITISQLRKIIREQFQAQSGPAPRTQMSLEDTGPFMRNAIVRSAMGEINHWKGLTTEWETTQQYQTMNVDKPTFESYVDSALDEIRAKVDSGDFTVPQNMVGMREMKINKADLKRMIKEEFSSLSEVYHGDPYAQHGGDPSANILPSKPPAHWRPRQRAAWNKLKAYRSDLAT